MSENVLDEAWMRDVRRRVIDAPADAIKFANLLAEAREICLSDVRSDSSSEEQAIEPLTDPVIAHLGMRGIRNALELLTPLKHYDEPPNPDDDYDQDPDYFFAGYDSNLRRPQVFGDAPNPEVLRAVEAFGSDLLAEAWKTLGTDAKAKVQELRMAEDDEDQIEVLRWLNQRLRAMKSPDLTPAGELPEPFYHPARLSPKLSGQFPHHAFEPTCLGLSIIASSFMEQSGLPHMHASMMRSYHYEMTTSYRMALEAAAISPYTDFSEPTVENTLDIIEALEEAAVDMGFHTVSIARLKSGKWFCVDPNFDLNYEIADADHAEKLSQAHDEMQQFAAIGAPVEMSVRLAQPSVATVLNYITKKTEFTFDVSSVKAVLLSDDPESLCQRIAESVARTLQADMQSAEPFRSVLELYIGETDGSSDDSIFSVALKNVIYDTVMWDMEPGAFLKRCNGDAWFLSRRLEDINNAIYLAIAEICEHEANHYAKYRDEYRDLQDTKPMFHEVLECGLPAQRIGAAVLSDFDAYASPESQLTPSFWLTHWASQVPITETRGRAGTNEAQERRLTSAMSLLSMSLNYQHQNAIISKYLRAAQYNDEQE